MDSKLITIYEKETGAHYTDNLTGLLNHGFFEMALYREFKRSERDGDEPRNVRLLEAILRPLNYEVIKASRNIDMSVSRYYLYKSILFPTW